MSSVVYWLKPSNNPTTSSEKTGQPRSFPQSFGIKSYQQIKFVDPESRKTRKRYIRYLPFESSIYVDEQTTDFSPTPVNGVMINVEPSIRFPRSGRLVTDDDILIAYLDAVKENEENAEFNGYKRRTFFRYDTTKMAKKRMSMLKADQDIRDYVFNMSKEAKISVAKTLNIIPPEDEYSKDFEVIEHDLMASAIRNPEGFKDIAEHAYNVYRGVLYSAVSIKILSHDKKNNSLVWSTGDTFIQGLKGEDIFNVGCKYLDVNKQAFESLKERVYPSAKPPETTPVDEVLAELDSIPTIDLIKKASQLNIVEYKVSTKLYYYKDKSLMDDMIDSKGKEGAAIYLEKNPALLQEIRNKVVLAVS